VAAFALDDAAAVAGWAASRPDLAPRHAARVAASAADGRRLGGAERAAFMARAGVASAE
jgi:hypothetical protein